MNFRFDLTSLVDDATQIKNDFDAMRAYKYGIQNNRTPKEISPAEKARRILQTMEMEENKSKKSTPPPQQADNEGISMEGPNETITPAGSPVYEGDLTLEPVTLKFDQTSLIQGLIYAEILGKPRSRRMGRW